VANANLSTPNLTWTDVASNRDPRGKSTICSMWLLYALNSFNQRPNDIDLCIMKANYIPISRRLALEETKDFVCGRSWVKP
jgi:hypothetical protein